MSELEHGCARTGTLPDGRRGGWPPQGLEALDRQLGLRQLRGLRQRRQVAAGHSRAPGPRVLSGSVPLSPRMGGGGGSTPPPPGGGGGEPGARRGEIFLDGLQKNPENRVFR